MNEVRIENLIERVNERAMLSATPHQKGPLVLMAAGLGIVLVAAITMKGAGFTRFIGTMSLGLAIGVPAMLAGMYLAGEVVRTSFGTLRSAVLKAASLQLFFQAVVMALVLLPGDGVNPLWLGVVPAAVCLLQVMLFLRWFDLDIGEGLVSASLVAMVTGSAAHASSMGTGLLTL